MMSLEILFWVCAGALFYSYAGYAMVLGLLAFFRGRPRPRSAYHGSVSIVLVVHNEEKNLSRRLEELTSLLHASQVTGDVIVVSDGSTDRSVQIAQQFAFLRPVQVLARKAREGKAAALTRGSQAARGDILVFADARQRWADDALVRLLENFADPQVGAVSGDLKLETAPGLMTGVGVYWRLEKWLRKKESEVYAQVGVTGAISAVRRELFRPIPAGTLLDDVYWPLRVAMQGYRVVHDERAVAYDVLPEKAGDEFRRKMRTLAGNFQLITRLPASLVPWRNPVWFQLVSHKLLRLLMPWALVCLLATNVFLPGIFFRCILASQASGYALAAYGLTMGSKRRVPLAATAGSFLVLNAAAFLGFWVWLSGRAGQSWSKVSYKPLRAPAPSQAPELGSNIARAA